MGFGRWFQETVVDNIIRPAAEAIDVALDPVEDWLQDNVWDPLGDDIEEEIFDTNSADTTAEIQAEHGTRPDTDGPVNHVLTFDGTGQDGGSTIDDIATSAVENDQQQVADFAGSGTEHSGLGNVFNQASGADIPNNILEGYRYGSLNVRPGDTMDIYGYSRGGFEALSLTGMIEKIGLIDTENMSAAEVDRLTEEALELYLDGASDAEIQQWKDDNGITTHQPASINLGLIDPVATRLPNGDNHDIDASNADNVYVVYAIDEDANFLEPIQLGHLPNVTATWFPGDHASVAGTNSAEQGLAAAPANWLIDNMNTPVDPVEFNALVGTPDPLVPVSNFGDNSFPISLGGHSTRPIPAGDQIHSSATERDEQVANYNPVQLQNSSMNFAGIDPSFLRSPITDSSGNPISIGEAERGQFDTSNMLFTGLDTSGLDFDIDLQALRDPQPFLSISEQGPWESAVASIVQDQPSASPEDTAPTRDNNALTLG